MLLDNQANVSVVHQDLLHDNKTFFDPLFRVYVSEDTHANILSLSEVEDRYLVTYVILQENFTVHLPETDIVFHRKAGMYVADWGW